ncbi:MAG: AAA family ATPase [Eubacteriales bacterium]|nr:AAA family ATPase [Eubacteriales bacterium]
MANKKLHIVIVDTDRDFVKGIEEAIIARYARTAEVQFITDPGYIGAYFSAPQSIDLLLVDESDYASIAGEHSILRTFLMVDEAGEEKQYPEDAAVVLKFLDVQEILDKMETALAVEIEVPEDEQEKVKRDTKIVAVYSSIGGCGKSLSCVALARKLKMLDQKVLLVGCDAMQSISVFYPSNAYAGQELAEKLKNPDEDTYWTILQNIGFDEVSYVLPFEKSLKTMGIGFKEIDVLVDTLRENRDFDYIILDVGTDLTPEIAEDLSQVDSMILLTQTNEISNKKLQKLLKDPDLLPKCNCILVANEYCSDGLRISRDSIFGSISPYATWKEVLDDPIFYQIALSLVE